VMAHLRNVRFEQVQIDEQTRRRQVVFVVLQFLCLNASRLRREYPDRGSTSQVGVVASDSVIPIQDLRVTFIASSSALCFKCSQILSFRPLEINTGSRKSQVTQVVHAQRSKAKCRVCWFWARPISERVAVPNAPEPYRQNDQTVLRLNTRSSCGPGSSLSGEFLRPRLTGAHESAHEFPIDLSSRSLRIKT
jgi:hypothetical protein